MRQSLQPAMVLALMIFGLTAQHRAVFAQSTPATQTGGSGGPAVSFAETGQKLNPLAGVGVAIADFNGDGKLDAFITNQESKDGRGNRVYFGDGHGRFTDSGQILGEGYGGAPNVCDLDGDGRIDVLTGNTIWRNEGQGRFASQTLTLSKTEQLGAAAFADLDGDGKLDAVASNPGMGAGYRVLLNDGKGGYIDTGRRFGAGGMQPTSVVLGDLNGDGSADAVTTSWRDNAGEPNVNKVWLNDGKGNFRDSGQLLDEGVTHVHGVALGDVNGDGVKDIVLALWNNSKACRIFLNDGHGRFTISQTIPGKEAHNVKIGDFNGDGSPDLFLVFGIVGSKTANQVWLNDGHGHFRNSGVRLGSEYSPDAGLGDFNGDGKLDAFVVHIAYISWDSYRGAPAEVWLNTTH